jgi:hypothetical protein
MSQESVVRALMAIYGVDRVPRSFQGDDMITKCPRIRLAKTPRGRGFHRKPAMLIQGRARRCQCH